MPAPTLEKRISALEQAIDVRSESRERIRRLTRTPAEVAEILGVGKSVAYALIRSGRLRSIRLGRNFLVPLSAIDDFLAGK